MGVVASLQAGQAAVAKLDFTQSEVDQLKRKLLELTEATVVVRGPKRDANGQCIYIEVPNVGIQLAATVKALEFSVGKPKQMIEVNDPGQRNQAPGMQDLGKLLAKNPEIALSVIKALKDGVAISQAIDVTSTSEQKPGSAPESQSGASPSESR